MANNDEEATVQDVRDLFRGIRATGTSFSDQLQQLVIEPSADNDSTAGVTGFRGATSGGQPTIQTVKDRYQRVAYVDNLSESFDSDPLGRIKLSRLVRYADGDDPESDNPVFMLDALIFIQGVEVSDYITGSINISKSTMDGHNRVTFTLENSDDRFVWSERNLRGALPLSNPKDKALQAQLNAEATSVALSGTDAQVAAATKALHAVEDPFFAQNEDIKRQIFTYKSDPARNPRVRSAKNVPAFARFDLAPNKAIFQRMDPIRVFTLYPWRVPGSTDVRQLWMPEFAGYIENVSIEDDDIKGRSTVTIEAVDIVQAILRRMRVSADVSLGLANPFDDLGFRPLNVNGSRPVASQPNNRNLALQQEAEDKSELFYNPNTTQFYDDIIHDSLYGQEFFPNATMEDAITQLLVFQPNKLSTSKPNRGVRAVELGGTFHYDPVNSSKDEARRYFEDYHKFCLFGPKRRPWTRSEVDAVGKGTTTDGDFNPNNCRLWFLLPADGSGPKNIADLSTITANITHEVNWTNRAEVLTNLLSSIDYRGFIAPTGDFIIEFPMADFRPEDFGEFKQTFRVKKGLISSSFGDEQDEPVAGLIVTTGFVPGHNDLASPEAKAFFQQIFAFSPYIAARYGLTVDTKQLPFIFTKDKAVAQQRAIIEFQKLNARCHALNMTFSYRPFILPNRPLHHLRRTRMGITVSVDYEYQLDATPRATTTAGLEHIRTFTGYYRQPDDLAKINPVQQDELVTLGGFAAPSKAQGIDPTSAPDEIELQVYNTIMAGESTPTSARAGWGTDNSALSAPASGVYLIDLQKKQQTEQPSVVSADEAAKTDQAKTVVNDQPDTDNQHKFKHDPLDTMIRTSPYGKRTDPKNPGRSEFHEGLDLAGSVGDPVYAVDDGKIAFSGNGGNDDGGNVVTMDTDDGYHVRYFHLSERLVQAGQQVTAGTLIGRVGATGRVTGPHLHIEVAQGDTHPGMDPQPMMPGTVIVRK